MSDTQETNYPDILGYITGGPRAEFDAVQCAVTTRPDKIGAGQNFEGILLVQSAVDTDVDVIVEFDLPNRDHKRQKGMFFAKSTRLQVGLQPAEVGYIKLPAACSPKTTPGDGYVINFKLQVKRMGRGRRIRLPHGGGGFLKSALDNHIQQEIDKLQQLTFSVETGGKRNQLEDTFAVLARAGIAKLRELQPGWVSLWTMRDHLDDRMILNQAQDDIERILPQIKRDNIFKPLLQTTQNTFKEMGYPLHVAEAVFITKLVTLMLELDAKKPLELYEDDEFPSWMVQMARLIFQDKRYAQQPGFMLTRPLYPAVLHDAVSHAFVRVKTVLNEDFGNEQEMAEYADTIVQAVTRKQPLDFARVYLPLVAAGVIANPQITMPRENVRDTIYMLSRALEERAAERNPDNDFIFKIVDNLIQRALEHF
jgi:hypothetical protein